jgi:predicted ATPase
LVGRETLLAEVEEQLSDPACRLLTLVGPGGSGKTRLALEAAIAQIHGDATGTCRYVDGVYWVSLAPLRTTKAVVPTIAQAIGFSFYAIDGGTPDPKTQLFRYLRNKCMLLILDNAEHLLATHAATDRGVEGTAIDILNAAPQVTILVTSRARMNVPGERIFPIGGMELPPPLPSPQHPVGSKEQPLSPAEAQAYSAVALFAQSARQVQPDFALDDETLKSVIRICHLVDGMPLAILLAAAWMQALPPAKIARELASVSGTNIDFLEIDWRTVPERQRSMRAVFDHSWRLLSRREQVVMQALSVFSGGCTRDAAKQVVEASPRELRALISRSLLEYKSNDRYEMHSLLHQYAATKLQNSPDEESALRKRHAAYYAGALSEWAADLKSSRQIAALQEIEADINNVRAAWDWMVEHVQIEQLGQMMEGLGLFYDQRARYEEGKTAFRTASHALTKSACEQSEFSVGARSVQAAVEAWRSRFTILLEQSEAAKKLMERSLDLLPAVPGTSSKDVQRAKAFVLRTAGEIAYQTRGYEQAKPLCAQSVTLYRTLGDRWGLAKALVHLGGLHDNLGESDEAQRLQQEALSIHRALGDPRGIVTSLERQAITFQSRCQFGDAERLELEAVAICREMGDRAMTMKALWFLAATKMWIGKFSHVCSLLQECLDISNDLALDIWLGVTYHLLGKTKAHLGCYEEAVVSLQKALALAQQTAVQWCEAMALQGLGLAALVKVEYEKSRCYLHKSVAILQEIEHYSDLSRVLCALSLAARGQGQPAQAQAYLCESIQGAVDVQAARTLLFALPVAALLLVDRGQAEKAVETYAVASSYAFVARSCWFKDIAGHHITVAASELPPDVVAAAQERGRARDLWATAKELQEELGGSPSG